MTMPNYPDTQLYIDGEWRAARDGRTLPVVNPATEAIIGHVAHAGTTDLDAALKAAQAGFDIWRKTPAIERHNVLRRAAELLRERAADIGSILTQEQGKPLSQGVGEARGAADRLDWFAAEAVRITSKIISPREVGITQIAIKRPVGPVAAFTPWNFPIHQIIPKLGGALAAGCSIILKPSEETPASPAQVVQAFHDAGLPPGVLNLVYGDPAAISAYLIPHPAIRKVSFTGSTGVGKQLAALAGAHMKRVTMELGGHAPVIITGDVDVAPLARQLGRSKVRNAGQVCVSPTRFLIEASVADEFAETLAGTMATIRLGNGLDSDTEMGPLANPRRLSAMESLVADATSRGATLVCGGRRRGNLGWFFEPTVLANVPTHARTMNEEPFGPLAIVNKFETLDAAIEEANRLPYGLAAYGYSRSVEVADRLADEVQAGVIAINHNAFGMPELPNGGIKDSGIGSEGGDGAMEAYLETGLITRKKA